jgi:cyclopropane-fatty-acyl-phospholipid synthase
MIARAILRKIFERLAGGAGDTVTLRVEFADGSVYQNYSGDKKGQVLVRFRSKRAERYSLLFFYEGMFDCYVNGEIDLEGEHPITDIAYLGHQLGMTPEGLLARVLRNPLTGIRQWAQERRQDNTDREQAIRNADFHYALPVALFEHMLSDTVGYSEGLWTSETKTLNQAKYNLYELICRKLRLERGMKVLEVGSGWGYMPLYMAKQYGAEVTVYNPVQAQNDYMRERFRRQGMGDAIRLVEGEHRDIAQEKGRFDRFLSIGVHEHAGYPPRQYRLWADAIAAALKDGGLGVVSTTSFMSRQMTNYLTLRYIFPGGHLPSLPDTLTAFHRAGLMLVEVENVWPHYQRTLMEWRDRFARQWPDIQKTDPAVFTESFRRRWTMYLQGTVEVFRDSLDLSHIVFTKGRKPEYFPAMRGFGNAEAGMLGGDREPDPLR